MGQSEEGCKHNRMGHALIIIKADLGTFELIELFCLLL